MIESGIKKFWTAGLLLLAMVLLSPIAAANLVEYPTETNAVGRIVGDSPTELDHQLGLDDMGLKHATYVPADARYLFDSVSSNKATIIAAQFPGQNKEIISNSDNDGIDAEISNFQQQEYFVLERKDGTISGKQLMLDDAKRWLPYFQRNSPLFLLNLNVGHGGLYLPKENSFTGVLGQDAITVTTNSGYSEEFTKSFICNLALYGTIGEAFKAARNDYYLGTHNSKFLFFRTNSESIGTTLYSYSLYGNPLATVSLPQIGEARLRDYCLQYIPDKSVKTQFATQSLSETIQAANEQSFKTANERVEQEGNYAFISADNLEQAYEPFKPVLPHQAVKHDFPFKTVIRSIKLSSLDDPVDLLVPNLPSWNNGLVDRICAENTKPAGIEFSHTFTDDKEIVLIQINPVEVVDCEKGLFRLYRKVTYDLDFIPYSDVMFGDVESPASGAPGSEAVAQVELRNIKEEATSGKLVVRNGKEVLSAQMVELSPGESKSLGLAFSLPLAEGSSTFELEYLDGDEVLTSKKFTVDVYSLKLSVNVPSKVGVWEDAEIRVTVMSNENDAVIGASGSGVLSLAGAPAAEGLSNGLVGYWAFEDKEGHLTDDFGEGDSVSEKVTSRIAEGIRGSAWDFEKDNGDWVGLPAAVTTDVTGGKPRSTSVWVKPESIESLGAIIVWGASRTGCDTDFKAIENGFVDYFGFDNCGNVQAAESLNAGEWHHFVFTDDGSERRIYMNGELTGSGNSAGSVTPDAADIGAEHWDDSGATNYHFDGLIDEVAIWSRALSQDEVALLYGSGDKPVFCTGNSCSFHANAAEELGKNSYSATYSLLKGDSPVVSGSFDGVKLSLGENILPVKFKTEGLEPGSYTFEVRVSSEDYTKTAYAQFFIAQLEEAAPQLADMPSLKVPQGAIVSLNPSAVDLNGDYVTYTFSEPFSRFGKWQTGKHHEGEYKIDIVASDGKTEDKKTVIIRVVPERSVDSFANNVKEEEFTFTREREEKTAEIRLLKKAKVTEATIKLEAWQQ